MALNFKQIGVGNIGNPADYMREARQGLNDGLEKLDTLADDIAKDNYAEARSPIEEDLFLLNRDIDAAESTDEIDKLMADFRTQSQGTPGYTVADLAGIEDKAETRTDTLVQAGINDAADQRLDAAELAYQEKGDATEFNAIRAMTTDEYMETYGIQDRATAETRQAADIARATDAVRGRVSREVALAEEAEDFDEVERLLRENKDWMDPEDLNSKLNAVEADRNTANYEAVVREFAQVGQENATRVGEMNVLVSEANSALSTAAPGWGIAIDDETGAISLNPNPKEGETPVSQEEAQKALDALLSNGELQEAVTELWTNAPDMSLLNQRLTDMYVRGEINRERYTEALGILGATMPKLTAEQQADVDAAAQAVEIRGQLEVDRLSAVRATQQLEVDMMARRASEWADVNKIEQNFMSMEGRTEDDYADSWGDEYADFIKVKEIPAGILNHLRQVAGGLGLNLADAKYVNDLPIELQGLFAHEVARGTKETTWGILGDADFSEAGLQTAFVTAVNAYKRLADGRQAVAVTDANIAQVQLDTANAKRQTIRDETNAYMMTQDTQTFMRAMDRRNEAPEETTSSSTVPQGQAQPNAAGTQGTSTASGTSGTPGTNANAADPNDPLAGMQNRATNQRATHIDNTVDYIHQVESPNPDTFGSSSSNDTLTGEPTTGYGVTQSARDELSDALGGLPDSLANTDPENYDQAQAREEAGLYLQHVTIPKINEQLPQGTSFEDLNPGRQQGLASTHHNVPALVDNLVNVYSRADELALQANSGDTPTPQAISALFDDTYFKSISADGAMQTGLLNRRISDYNQGVGENNPVAVKNYNVSKQGDSATVYFYTEAGGWSEGVDLPSSRDASQLASGPNDPTIGGPGAYFTDYGARRVANAQRPRVTTFDNISTGNI